MRFSFVDFMFFVANLQLLFVAEIAGIGRRVPGGL
jgi:hypothetical protein